MVLGADGSEFDASGLRIAVIIPCYNESAAIGQVVADFREHLPQAAIYVYDNNSVDGTDEVARAAGAVVRYEPRQGKGYVVRRMFADIEADVYVMVDGDDTYEAAAAPRLVAKLVGEGLDMVNGARTEVSASAYRFGHKFGNWMLSRLVRLIFGDEYRDMLSGFRVFSRRFVKSFPAMSSGFEIETELTIHALEIEMPSAEVKTAFKDRPEGSVSKLKSIPDGIRIVYTISRLLKSEKPILFFGLISAVLMLAAIIFMIPVFQEYLETGLVPRLPTAVLAVGLTVLAFLSLTCGLVLDTVTRGRQELKRLRYLEIPGVASRVAELREAGAEPVAAAAPEPAPAPASSVG